MKSKSVSLGFLAATLFAGSAWAAGEPPAGAPPPPPAPEGEHRPLREEMLQRFDANHDGKLDDAERATARAAWQQRWAGHGGPEGFRGPGGGPWGPHEFAGRGERGEGFHGRGHFHRHWRKMMRMRHWRRMHQRQAMAQGFNRDGEHRFGAAGRPGGEMRARFEEGHKQLLERFDANHDGKLDENERKSAHDAWQEFIQQRPVLAAPAAPAKK